MITSTTLQSTVSLKGYLTYKVCVLLSLFFFVQVMNQRRETMLINGVPQASIIVAPAESPPPSPTAAPTSRRLILSLSLSHAHKGRYLIKGGTTTIPRHLPDGTQ